MIKLKVNHDGKLTNEVRSSGLQQGEQFFRTIQITTPKFIQGVNITSYEVKMILKLKGEKYIYDLQLQKEKNGTLKYGYDVFPGLTESIGEFEICLMWVYGKNQYISNILKITVNNTLLSGEIKDINEYLDEYKLEIDKVMSVSRQLEEKDKDREINEEARTVAEKSRELTFETWNTKFKEFIDNDSIHQINENQRIITINQITEEWEELKNQLSESDIQNMDRKINEIKNTISNHVKTLKVNETNNTIEAYLEKDTTIPTFKLGLPRGFSGSYNDLIDKPDLTNYVYVVDTVRTNDYNYKVYSDGTCKLHIRKTVSASASTVMQNASTGTTFYIGNFYVDFPVKFKYYPHTTLSTTKWSTGSSWGFVQNSFFVNKVEIRLMDNHSRPAGDTTVDITVEGEVNLNDYKL